MNDKIFWDSNLWIYLFVVSTDPNDLLKQSKLRHLLGQHPQLFSSVQVLNEVANALMKKYAYSATDAQGFIEQILLLTHNQPLFNSTTRLAFDLKKRYTVSWYDSLIIAAALEAHCNLLFSEDLQDGLVVDGILTIRNPFLVL